MDKIRTRILNDKKIMVIFLCGVFVALATTGICFTIRSFQINEQEKAEVFEKEKETEKKVEIKKSEEQKNTDLQNQQEKQVDQSQPSSDINTENNSTASKIPTSNHGVVTSPKTEADVVEYFYQQELLVLPNSEQDITIRQRIKDGVTTIYNFLFHGGTIYGKTFQELSSSAKLKVLNIALSIDQKIDSYFPNYKESIKQGASNLKSKIVITYLETINRICSNHEEICTQAREDFQTMKKSFQITFSLIKDFAKSGSIALKEWYLNIR